MGKVFADITMSLDGFVAGEHISREHPLGVGGERLHEWIFAGKTDADSKLLDEVVQTSGVVIVGGRTYLTAIDDAWGGVSPFDMPAFVILKDSPATRVAGFSYITDGIENALAQAKIPAGDKNVWVMGGAGTIQAYLKAGLLEEFQIHIAPVLLGAGLRLFDPLAEKIELENVMVLQTPAVTHLRFRVK